MKAIPTGVENDLDALNLHPYGRKLLRRLPEWMRLMTEYTRSGVEDDQPVLRCYLPSIAAPNLLMGTRIGPGRAAQPRGPAVAVDEGRKKPQIDRRTAQKEDDADVPPRYAGKIAANAV